ncbi:hypothetical protein KJ671_03405 [Patescibacteria group bacterium]|nr:hypothetical protein [Patescibacteria group bacterium]
MNLLKTHKIIFPVAFIIGLLIVLPTLSAILKLGISEFQGVYPMFSNDEDHYLAKIQDVYDGHLSSGNPFLKEYKDASSLQQPLAEIILGGTAKILRISVPVLTVINDFLLPFIGVIALYAAVFIFVRSRNIAILTAFSYYFVFIYIFNRPINPQFSFIFLFLSIFLIYKIISTEEGDTKKILKLNFWLAVVFGVEFYTYPFCWTATFVLYFLVLFFLSIRKKRFFHWKGALLFLITIAVISIPYVLNLKMGFLDLSYVDSNLRFGFIDTRIPSAYFNVGLATMGLVALFFSRKYFKDQKLFIFLSSLGLSGIILNWQNIITGKALSFSMHYYWIVVLFLFLIIAGILSVIKKEKLSLRVFIVSVLIISSILIILNRALNKRQYCYCNKHCCEYK